MLSYEGIIRKRLHLKGHPEIPAYHDESPESAMLSAENLSGIGAGETAENPTSPVESEIQPGGSQSRDEDQQGVEEGRMNDDSRDKDTRTGAEVRHDETGQQREKERLSKIAGKSYREHIDVSYCTFRAVEAESFAGC